MCNLDIYVFSIFKCLWILGKCQNRPKRALMPDDDSIDDQDTIPPFNPDVTSVNLTLTWPTPSGITKENVTQFCEKKLRFSNAGQACNQLSGVNVDSLVQQCITDIQVGICMTELLLSIFVTKKYYVVVKMI